MSTLHASTLALIGTAALALGACTDSAPLDPQAELTAQTELAAHMGQPSPSAQTNRALAELRRATARYHDVDAALEDGFIPVGECEAHEGESPGGIPYANLDYLVDGSIDPARPDALLYEPDGKGGVTLVGVELAMPYVLWSAAEPPEFLGEQFRREDEMGVFGLHIWVWRNNPDGMFAWGNPRVSCGEEA
jgi:hypothetical protein